MATEAVQPTPVIAVPEQKHEEAPALEAEPALLTAPAVAPLVAPVKEEAAPPEPAAALEPIVEPTVEPTPETAKEEPKSEEAKKTSVGSPQSPLN
jgi:hypothetical protein